MENFFVKVNESIIDNQFFSHKDNKVLDLRKIYEKSKEPMQYSLNHSPGMVIKHKNKIFPTILLFHSGSYTFPVGKMENVKVTNKFIKELIMNYTIQ